MPQNTTKNAKAGDFVELTDGDAASVSFQNIGRNFILVKGTAGAVKPTDRAGAYRYNPGQGEKLVKLADLFPGVAGVNRLWVYAEAPTEVTISHA